MKKSLLFSLFGFFVILTVTTLIILYANGYTYNLDANKIEKTGVIKITTTPGGGNVYLNNINEGTSPVSVFNLNVGSYLVTVKKDGFDNWTSKIDIKPGKISLIYPVLYPTNIKATRVESQNSIDNAYFGKGIYAYSAKGKNNTEDLYVHTFGGSFLNLGENTQIIFNTGNSGLDAKYTIQDATFSTNNGRLLLKMSAAGLPDKYLYVTTDGTQQVINIDSIIDTSLYQTIMPGKDDEHLLLQNNNLLISLDITNGQKIILVQADTNTKMTNFAISNGLIYYVLDIKTDKDLYSLYSAQLDGTSATLINTQPDPITNIITTNTDYAYSIANKGMTIYYPEISITPITIPGANLTPLTFSPDTKYLLYKDAAGKLYTYSLETAQSYDLTLNQNDLVNIVWDKNSRMLFYTSKDAQQSGNYFDINGVNYDGSNKETIYKGLIENPNITISPSDGRLVFEMGNLSLNQSIDKGIYQIAIQGI